MSEAIRLQSARSMGWMEPAELAPTITVSPLDSTPLCLPASWKVVEGYADYEPSG